MSRSLVAELKRRNVFKAGVAYLALGWVVTQVTSTVAPAFNLPGWIVPVVVWIGVIGFPFVIAFSWIYELTPEGLKRESEIDRSASITHVTGRRIDYLIVVLLVLAIGFFAIDGFVLMPRREAAHDASLRSELVAESSKRGQGDPASAVPEIEKDPSIAVLPMVNMSEDKANEFFSDGISEELLNLLAKVPRLRVIARTSSFSFKGKDTSIPDIARVLHVASVLEGSVRKSGDKVRITAQLIRSSDGSHLWSETYDRKLDDIFKVQDEIAAAVVAQLKIKLLGAAPTAKPVDPRIYPLILQGQALLDQQTVVGRTQAIEAYRKALKIAPDEARAWAGLSRAYLNQVIFAETSAKEGAPAAREAANKALAIDPGNQTALALLGRLAAEIDFDLPAGARYYQRALELEPGSLMVLNAAGLMLAFTGRMDEALALLEYRVAHDPANPTAYNNLASVQSNARRWDAAIDSFRTAIRLSPEYPGAHAGISTVLLLGKHDATGALKECEAEQTESQREPCAALALHALGHKKDADAALQAFVDKYANDQPSFTADIYAFRGDADAAFAWLNRAVTSKDPNVSGALTDPLLDSLHGDPRWIPFLRTIGFAPEQLAKIEFKVTLPAE
jgi:TolB-like protein/cytochrome c-type biogenesis protein CcmH/NrfG